MSADRCFACGRALGKSPALVDTRDAQYVYVGRECYKLIAAAGEDGYQPPIGGPRLYLVQHRGPCILSMMLDVQRGQKRTCICDCPVKP